MYRAIGEQAIDLTQPIWRYMKVSRFEELLDSSAMYFASANEFEDPFEGAVAVQPYNWPVDPRYDEFEGAEKAFRELKRLTKISCWHIESFESNAMWNLYSDEGKGIAIVTTPGALIENLVPYRIKPEYDAETFCAGDVNYVDLLQERLKVSMLDRFFFKHRAFSWEKEFRVVISLRMAEEYGVKVPETGIHVGCNPEEIIQAIYLGPSVSQGERGRLISKCAELGLTKNIVVSSMLGKPRYV